MKTQLILCTVLAAVIMTVVGPPNVQAKEVAVIWDTKSAMVNNVMMGFLTEIKGLAPDLKITMHRELKNMEEAGKVFHQEESRVDGIVFLRSSGAEYLGKVRPKVPCFIGACNNPTELGVIQNPDAPEGMVTGVTYFIPHAKRFAIIMELFPNIKTVGLLIEKGHPSGPIESAGTKEQCSHLGLTYREVLASNLNELVEGTRQMGKVDLLIITNTRIVMDNVTSLLPIANANNIPLFSYAERPVQAGAVAGIAANDLKLGTMLAQSVVDVVVKGKPISQVPVKMDSEPKIAVNEAMKKGLGLTFPERILQNSTIIR
jgi:putative tryptophan/tyrosine transport system substrate-binding protein